MIFFLLHNQPIAEFIGKQNVAVFLNLKNNVVVRN